MPLLPRLLVKLGLDAPLCSLARIMLGLRLLLLNAIAREPGNSTADSPTNAIADALAIVAELALSFLSLAVLVLLDALLLQPLGANEPTKRLFARANRLVPRAFAAVGVILAHAAGRDAVPAHRGAGVRDVVFECCFILFALALGLSVSV